MPEHRPDADGNFTQSINRRNQAIDYTYDDRGLILRKDHADGTFEEFTYDDRGNLRTATDEAGTTDCVPRTHALLGNQACGLDGR
jgi:YD repeat-containing protein